VPQDALAAAGEKLIELLMEYRDEMLWDCDVEVGARKAWARLCADVMAVCDLEELRAFWGKACCGVGFVVDGRGAKKEKEWLWSADTRSSLWKTFMEMWKGDTEASWEGCVVVLAAPFLLVPLFLEGMR
jgi:hypothetical protein